MSSSVIVYELFEDAETNGFVNFLYETYVTSESSENEKSANIAT